MTAEPITAKPVMAYDCATPDNRHFWIVPGSRPFWIDFDRLDLTDSEITYFLGPDYLIQLKQNVSAGP